MHEWKCGMNVGFTGFDALEAYTYTSTHYTDFMQGMIWVYILRV